MPRPTPARRAHTATVKAERSEAAAVTKLDRQVESSRRQCMAQRDPLVSEGLEPPHVEGELVEAWDDLVAWAASALPTHEAARDAETDARTRSASTRRVLVHLRDAATEVGVDARDDPSLSVLGQRAAVAERDAKAERPRIRRA